MFSLFKKRSTEVVHEESSDYAIDPHKVHGPKGTGDEGKGLWKFDVEKVLIPGQTNSYSIAVGIMSSESFRSPKRTLAIRWNGSFSESDVGFPKISDPQWFPLPPELTDGLLSSLAKLDRDELLESLVSKG